MLRKLTPTRKLTLLAALAVSLAAPTLLQAQDSFTVPATPEEIVSLRVDLMKENGGILRNLPGQPGPDAVAALTKVTANFNHLSQLFPEGSLASGTEALPVIWERWDQFAGYFDQSIAASEAAVAAAGGSDAGAYASATRAIMGTCKQCHDNFRL